jgi:XRE family transcriptional regulator, fatty acid utilization regulator
MLIYQEVNDMTDAIGKRIKELRSSRGMTLRQLADRAQVPQSTLSMVETGTRSGHNLTLLTGKRLARALGVSLDLIAGVYDDESEPLTAVAS